MNTVFIPTFLCVGLIAYRGSSLPILTEQQLKLVGKNTVSSSMTNAGLTSYIGEPIEILPDASDSQSGSAQKEPQDASSDSLDMEKKKVNALQIKKSKPTGGADKHNDVVKIKIVSPRQGKHEPLEISGSDEGEYENRKSNSIVADAPVLVPQNVPSFGTTQRLSTPAVLHGNRRPVAWLNVPIFDRFKSLCFCAKAICKVPGMPNGWKGWAQIGFSGYLAVDNFLYRVFRCLPRGDNNMHVAVANT